MRHVNLKINFPAAPFLQKTIKKPDREKTESGLIMAILIVRERQEHALVRCVSQGELKEKKDDSPAVRC